MVRPASPADHPQPHHQLQRFKLTSLCVVLGLFTLAFQAFLQRHAMDPLNGAVMSTRIRYHDYSYQRFAASKNEDGAAKEGIDAQEKVQKLRETSHSPSTIAIYQNVSKHDQKQESPASSSLKNNTRTGQVSSTKDTNTTITANKHDKSRFTNAGPIGSKLGSESESNDEEGGDDGESFNEDHHGNSTNGTVSATNSEDEDDGGIDSSDQGLQVEYKEEDQVPAKTHETTSCNPLPPLRWEFQRYQNHTSKKHKPSQRLLIGMYSGFDSYARMLDVTAAMNKAYAKRWGHSTVVLQGVAMHLGELDGGYNCTPKAGVRAAFNKIKLLEYALNHTDQYDQLLLLDTDAMMYDLDFDITSMVQDDIMLVAHRVHKLGKTRDNWNVNNGVMLWNLQHPETAGTVADWEYYSRKNLRINGGYGGDQHQLHKALTRNKTVTRPHAVLATYGEFVYGRGTIIRHYIRTNKNQEELGWRAPNPLEERIHLLQEESKVVCGRHSSSVCNSIERVSYGEW